MTITAICGDIGSGKSLKQLAYALEQCNRKRKRLVTNFALNYREVRRYAGMKKFGWLAHIIDTNQVAVIDAANSLADMLIYPDSVVCLDEAGIFLNTREFSKTPKSLLMDLAQSRKTGCDLIYASQFDEQVDKQFRMLTQYFIHAQGVTVYDKTLRRPRLISKLYFYFTSSDYHAWQGDLKAKSSFFRTWFHYAFKMEHGLLNAADKQLFNCFSSFARLEQQESAARGMEMKYIEPDYRKTVRQTQRAAVRRDSTKLLGCSFPPPYASQLNRRRVSREQMSMGCGSRSELQPIDSASEPIGSQVPQVVSERVSNHEYLSSELCSLR